MSPDRGEPRAKVDPECLGGVRASLVAVWVLICVNAVVLALRVELPPQGWQLRGLHHLYDAGHHLAAGLLAALAVASCRRFRLTTGRRGLLVLAAVSLVIGAATLVDDLRGFAHDLLPGAPALTLWALVTFVSAGVVMSAIAGRWLARPRWRWLAVLGGTAALVLNHLVLEDDYPGAHLYLAIYGVTIIAFAIANAPLPSWWSRASASLPWVFGVGIAAFTLIVPTGNTLLLAMLRVEGSVVTPYLARLKQARPGGDVSFPVEWEPWFRPREDVSPVPPRRPRTLPEDPVVILFTIDSLRADVLGQREHDHRLPQLARLRDESLEFTAARAPGSQTVYTIGQMFMGTYYSMQYWTKYPGFRDLWPHEDETVRFPELLTDAGVPTVNFATTKWLGNAHGLVRGFAEDTFVEPRGTLYSLTAQTVPRIIERLEQHRGEPLFVFTHALDAHFRVSPRKNSNTFERYLSNLELVDESLGALRTAIDRLGIAERTVLIVSSDHGEAFGEHDTTRHRSTLYDELLRVPLLIHAPGIEPRKIETAVSLIDLGPTILDLFGQPTPGHFMGQSLAAFLEGVEPKLTRPIVAEGRLKKVMIFPDERKVIVDDRHNTSELYDLRRDPGELENLIDASPRASERVQVLRAFFEVHEIQREGYQVPYRP
jgi:arylsulfatase A-like enzyme